MTTLIKTLLKWNINFYPTSCVDSCFRETVKKNKQTKNSNFNKSFILFQ